MRRIDRDFVARGAARVTESDVARVFEHADAIGKKLERGGRLARVVDDAKLLLALVRDYWTRDYRAVPYWVVGAAVFALLYVLAPFDLVPDAIPGLGQLDDAAVVSVCLALVRQELVKYAAWRESRTPG
ncbi:MAG TPA: YkvA family protein [Polyangiaceae bacterium]|nr:YkvA family protein [Polyangiaceae bacterium]